MNMQFILNNEPRKQCHLANVQSILACDSLVWLWHSDAEVPMPGQRSAGWPAGDPQADFWAHASPTAGSAQGRRHTPFCSPDMTKSPICQFLLLCALDPVTGPPMTRTYKVLEGNKPPLVLTCLQKMPSHGRCALQTGASSRGL